MKNANDALRLRISALSKTYYQWKVATILSVDRGRQMAMEAIADAEEDMVEGQPVMVEILPTIVQGVPFIERGDRINEMDELRNQVAEKDGLIAQLQETIQNLMLESATKDAKILSLCNLLQQGQEVRQVRSRELMVVDDAMEVDDTIINNEIDTATIGVLEDSCTPAKRQCVALVLLPWGHLHDHTWTSMVH